MNGTSEDMKARLDALEASIARLRERQSAGGKPSVDGRLAEDLQARQAQLRATYDKAMAEDAGWEATKAEIEMSYVALAEELQRLDEDYTPATLKSGRG